MCLSTASFVDHSNLRLGGMTTLSYDTRPMVMAFGAPHRGAHSRDAFGGGVVKKTRREAEEALALRTSAGALELVCPPRDDDRGVA